MLVTSQSAVLLVYLLPDTKAFIFRLAAVVFRVAEYSW